jgi:hypothetical protein
MITTVAEIQVLVATKPVDFRKQADGLAAILPQTEQPPPNPRRFTRHDRLGRRLAKPTVEQPGLALILEPFHVTRELPFQPP